MEANVIPHLSVRERFVSNTAVLNNGFTITGTPTINDGISGFSAANYVTLPTRSVPNTQSYSFHIDTTLPAAFQTATTHILDGGANWSLEGNSGTNVITFHYDVGGVGQAIAIDCTTIMGNRVRISVSVYISGANILAYMHIDTLSVNASDAGAMTNLPTTIRMGSDTGANFYNGTIHEFWWLKGYALSELDHDKLVSGVFFSEISPERFLLFMPCANSYNDGANQVTDILGTTIPDKKVILGDGSTATTFPTLQPNRTFSFDGGDYINCGDYDDFTIDVNQPFSFGSIATLNTLSSSYGLICKCSHTLVNGEYCFYHSSGVPGAIRAVFIDEALGSNRTVNSNAVLIANVPFFVTVVYAGTGTINVNSVRIYINGEDETNGQIGTNITSIQNTNTNLVMGIFSSLLLNLNGRMSMPFMLKKQLSQLQVKTLYKLTQIWNYT